MSWWRPEFSCGDLHHSYQVGIVLGVIAALVGGVPEMTDFDTGTSSPFGITEIQNHYIVAGSFGLASVFAFAWFLYGWRKINRTSECQWTLKGDK